jgi:NAD(P)H-dependent flavin oxidoreductase YrpB (nitropropane dioxygenase family)
MRPLKIICIGFALYVVCVSSGMAAGAEIARVSSLPGSPLQVKVHPASQALAMMEQNRQRMLADDRQKKMLESTTKLLELAQQLKISVDKTDKNTLSVDVIRQADQIEKLAKQVKDEMRE